MKDSHEGAASNNRSVEESARKAQEKNDHLLFLPRLPSLRVPCAARCTSLCGSFAQTTPKKGICSAG